MQTRAIAALGVALFLIAIPAVGQQTDRGFSTQNFQLAPGYGSFLTVEGAQVPQGLGFRVGAMFDYQHRPLLIHDCAQVEDGSCTEWSGGEVPLIEHHLMAEVYGAISFFEVFEAAVVVPAVLYQSGEDVTGPDGTVTVESPGSAAGLDDIRLHLKLDLLHTFGYEGDTVGLALVPVVSFPVGNAISSDSFMGDSFLTFHPKLAFGANLGRVRLGLNGGYLWRQDNEFYLTEVGPRITYGAATEIGIVGGLSGVIEVFGQNGISADVASSPLEGDGAIRYTWTNGVALTVGGGGGIIGGVGTPMFRVFAGLAWASPSADRDGDGILDNDDACPDDPEDKDTFEDEDGCPDPDNDKDTILDVDDKCAFEAEDMDNFEDADGCPDVDNDGDGLMDSADLCPDEPEDVDGDEDEDGCPEEDKDKDQDGILIPDDKCPDEPEDKDGFEDADGCPDPDNDGDGILDPDDKCPLEKEVVNGVDDKDGCPDEALVEIREEQIVISDKVNFKINSAKIVGKKSFAILDAVAQVIESRPGMRVRIEGHTDSRAKRQHNMKLSKRRAASVKKYLANKGIPENQLESEGLGPDKPIGPNETKEGRAENRRVEFHIVEQ